MLIELDGQVVDRDPLHVAVEERVVRALRKHGPTRSRDLWYRSNGQRSGRAVFNAALDSLCERDVIRRMPTPRVGVFIYRVSSDKRRRERAERRQQVQE